MPWRMGKDSPGPRNRQISRVAEAEHLRLARAQARRFNSVFGKCFGDGLRCDDHARTNALQAVDDDILAGLQPAFDDAQAVIIASQNHLSVFDLVIGPDHEDEFLVLIGGNGAVAHHQLFIRFRFAEADADKLAGNEPAVRIVDCGANADRAGRGIDLIVDELDMTGNRGAFIGSGADLDRNALDGVSAGRGCKLGKRLGDDFLIGAEACIDRIDRNKRGQDRRGGTTRPEIGARTSVY